ncbi:phage tail protein [Psychrobacter sp. HD31]|uniref:phage tail protein n=1 Tax=Psychrobacter sp. HD31 TaxID=3112003 RepID=UPI003DA3F006
MGGGGKGGGGGHTPYEAPNTLESAQKIKIIDLLCEGVVGSDVTFKNIYLDNTPIQNDDGSYNFTGIKVSALPGTHNQDYLAGFDTTDKIVSVGAEVKQDTPITRTITDPLIDSVRVTLALGSLVTMKDNGDRVGGAVSLTVMCGDKSYPVTISGKTTSAYHQDVVLTELPDPPFNISVHRNTPDSTTDKVSNKTHWVSYVESIHAKFSFPHSVVVGLEIDSAQFGGKIPTRTYKNRWTQLKVPANYNPINRTYEGIWNGEFKTAWSNNPAWVFYDIVTDKRYGFGERLEGFGSDKWWLYQIAKYCDQMVPDGFGGTEPRFTCNAYLSSPRNAKSVLDDLASVFRGIAVWDGQKVIALQDAKKDPVATYTNSNVEKDGFVYSGAAKKTIFTAVHVKYIDSQTAKTQTEYVSNDDAVRRYGLNVKQITAFACTSRGQAARFGKWLIETSIREGQMVSFTVGREGIRHLPFDIIEIADNDYAGDLIGGRVLAVSENVITVDSPITDIDSIRYYNNGQSRVVDVVSINDDQITLAETPEGIEQLSVFSATKTDVKPRLFRALGIKENSGGTYTISAVTHDEDKEAIVDDGVTFERENLATKHLPHINYGNVSKDGDELLIAWDGTNTSQYLIKIYKDDKLYKTYTQDTPEIRLKGLSNGDYRAEIRGKSANGQLTDPVIKEWSISYDINGLKATAELFAIKLDWTNPTTIVNKAKIEIYRSKTTFRSSATKVATLPYPTDTFTQNGIKLNETHYFWLRIIDEHGNAGDWATISGQCSDDASEIVKSISGQITETELAQSLIDSLQADIDTSVDSAKSELDAEIEATKTEIADVRSDISDEVARVSDKADDNATAIREEATARADSLSSLASEFDTQITDLDTTSEQHANRLQRLMASNEGLAVGLEEERQARIFADNAEASERDTLVAEIDDTQSSVQQLTKTVVNSKKSTAQQIATLNSKVSDIELGGRNLLIDSSNYSVTNPLFSNTVATTFVTSEKLNKKCFYTKLKKDEAYFIVKLPDGIKTGKELTFSFKFYRPYSLVTLVLRYGDATKNLKTVKKEEWVHGYFTFIKGDSDEVIIATTSTTNRTIWLSEFKLEHGGLATDWSPTPEDLISDISGITADITAVKKTQADQNETLTEQIEQAESSWNSALSKEKKARIDGDKKTTKAVASAEAKISGLKSTITNKDNAQTVRLEEAESSWNSALSKEKKDRIGADKSTTAKITQEATTRASKDNALSNRIDTVQSKANSNTAKITTLTTTVADNNRAISNKVTSLTAEVANKLVTSGSYAFANKTEFEKDWIARKSCKNLSFTNSGSVYIGANTNADDYGWYYARQKLAMSEQTLYKITFKLQKESGSGSLTLGVAGYDKDDNFYNSNGEAKDYTQWYAYSTSDNGNWQNVEIYIAGDDIDISGLDNVIKLDGKVRKIAPLFIANYANKTGRVKINAINVELVTASTKLARATTAKITQEATTRASKDNALSNRIDTVQSKANSNTAKITTLTTTVADNNRAISNKVTSLTAEVANKLVTSGSYAFANKTEFEKDWIARKSCKNLSFTNSGSVYIGANTNADDYGWYYARQKLAMSEQTLYKITFKLQKESGSGSLTLGVAGYDKDDNFYNSNGEAKDYTQWYAYSTSDNGNWQNVEIYIAGDDIDISGLDNVIKLDGKVRKIAPLFIANYANKTGRVKINAINVELVTASIGKAKSMHTIKTQAIAGGKRAIAGISIGAMANKKTVESQVIVMADKFGVVKNASDGTVKPMFSVVNNQVAVNGDLIAEGTILGKHIKANQTLTAPVINGGQLNINNRFIVDKYGKTTIQSATGNKGLKITHEKIEVYDDAGRLRVRLGKLS